MTLEEEKTAARKAAFARRKSAYAQARPDQAAHLSAFLAGHRGVPVSGFMPINTEIDPRPAMEEAAAHGRVGVPIIQGKGLPLTFAHWDPDTPMVEGPFKARIPANIQPMVPEIVIVPLVAFDRKGGRLGYGGGFYDRTLQGLSDRGPCLAVGFAFAAQEADGLPLEPADQPLDLIITESGVLSPR